MKDPNLPTFVRQYQYNFSIFSLPHFYEGERKEKDYKNIVVQKVVDMFIF